MLNGAGSPTLSNCILWNNMAVSDGNEISLAYPSDSNVTITYCDVQDGPNGISIEQGWNLDWDVGNIDLDPLFVDPYTENINDRDYHLLPSSPCIDAGDPISPWELEPTPNGARINMGAYGNTEEAAISRADLQFVKFNLIGKVRLYRTVFVYVLGLSLKNIDDHDTLFIC